VGDFYHATLLSFTVEIEIGCPISTLFDSYRTDHAYGVYIVIADLTVLGVS
jgi:hypothetical protein